MNLLGLHQARRCAGGRGRACAGKKTKGRKTTVWPDDATAARPGPAAAAQGCVVLWMHIAMCRPTGPTQSTGGRTGCRAGKPPAQAAGRLRGGGRTCSTRPFGTARPATSCCISPHTLSSSSPDSAGASRRSSRDLSRSAFSVGFGSWSVCWLVSWSAGGIIHAAAGLALLSFMLPTCWVAELGGRAVAEERAHVRQAAGHGQGRGGLGGERLT